MMLKLRVEDEQTKQKDGTGQVLQVTSLDWTRLNTGYWKIWTTTR